MDSELAISELIACKAQQKTMASADIPHVL